VKARIVPILFCFFVMGFGDAVGTFVGLAKDYFGLSASMAGLLPFFGFIAFALFSVPGGVLMGRRGKKFLLVLSLVIALVGQLVPSLTLASYGVLVAAVFVGGIGMALLQVAGNPIMRDVSAEGRYARNLTFGQFIKSLGSIAGPALAVAIMASGLAWGWIFRVFAACLALTLILVVLLKVEEKGKAPTPPSLASSFALLGRPNVGVMVLGAFLYVGAEVGLNSWVATYLHEAFAFDLRSLATAGIAFFFLALCVGRLVGSAVLHFLPARRFFVITALIGLVGTIGILVPVRSVSLVSIFVAGLGFGNVFPLIFSTLIDRMPEKSAELSGLLCMAIAGGAILPLVMGALADVSIVAAMLVPLASLVYLTVIAVRAYRAVPA